MNGRVCQATWATTMREATRIDQEQREKRNSAAARVGGPFGGAVSVESKHGNRRTHGGARLFGLSSAPCMHVRPAFTLSLRTHSSVRASLAFAQRRIVPPVNMTRIVLGQRARLRPVSSLLDPVERDRVGIA